jgi:hypothetical protein
MRDDTAPGVRFEAYNPATDEAPAGGADDCDGVDPDDEEGTPS